MISIDWLRKELTEMVFNGEISSDIMAVFFKLIARWKEHDGSD